MSKKKEYRPIVGAHVRITDKGHPFCGEEWEVESKAKDGTLALRQLALTTPKGRVWLVTRIHRGGVLRLDLEATA